MASTSETGHAKNVANFQDLIAAVIGYGAIYNPSKTILKLANLQTKQVAELANISTVISKNTAFNNAVNDRAIEFSDVRSLSTRFGNAFSSTDASDEKVNDVKGFNRKIQGKRASTAEAKPTDPNTPTPKSISASQQSYDQILQHWNAQVAIAQTEPSYTPNENSLKVVALVAKGAAMLAKNNTVDTEYINVSNARIARDKGLYTEKTGLIDIANEVKDYVKSIFGYTSPEYKQISKIKFTKPKTT
jgi:hypothetical protein